MSAINESTRAAWQSIAHELSVNRPYVSRLVRVDGGRKRRGSTGVVLRHQLSKYDDAYRYASEAQAHMRDMEGRSGWCCYVQPDDGSAPFWISAEHLTVLR